MAITRTQSSAIARKIARIEPRFAEIISTSPTCPIGVTSSRQSNFEALASSILSQQLSTKAADTIIARVAELSGGKLDASQLSLLSITTLRSAGCSGAKARAIKELAERVASGDLKMSSLGRKSDQEVINLLVPLYGVGRWTVEMYLMFQLGRQDIWPVDDLGVRRGWEKIHRRRTEIEPEQLRQLGDRFAPYRSHLAWYCWRAHERYK